jgi:hypothetical protein
MNIKDVLNNLNDNDKQLWKNSRTDMHRTYLHILHQTMGIVSIDEDDMAFLDLLDIKLAAVFERAGRFRELVAANSEDAMMIEAAINEKAKSLEGLRKTPLQLVDQASGTKGSGW